MALVILFVSRLHSSGLDIDLFDAAAARHYSYVTENAVTMLGILE